MQYPIPQFIEEEGKIIAFLTFKQFFWLVGAGGVCIIWYWILPFYPFVFACLITALAVGAIAFVKIDNASLITIFFNFLGFTMGQKNYTWKKKESAYPIKEPEKVPLNVIEQLAPAPKMQPSKLQSIKKMVETKR